MVEKAKPGRVIGLSDPNDYDSRIVGSIMAGPPGQRINAFQKYTSAPPPANKPAPSRNSVVRVVTGVDGRSPVIIKTTNPVGVLQSKMEQPLPSERASTGAGWLGGVMDTAGYGIDIPLDVVRRLGGMPKAAFKAGRLFGPVGSLAGAIDNFADAATLTERNKNNPNFDPTKAYTAAAISSLANAGISAIPVVGTAYGLLDSQFDLSDRIGQWGADAIEADGWRIRENPQGITFFPY